MHQILEKELNEKINPGKKNYRAYLKEYREKVAPLKAERMALARKTLAEVRARRPKGFKQPSEDPLRNWAFAEA